MKVVFPAPFCPTMATCSPALIFADTFLSIIKELKEQNPDIKFQKPPLLAGTIDNFIGVGTDHIT